MKPVDQEFTHDPEAGINGDCKRAVIASLLGLPISDVPHFLDGLTTDADASGLEFDRRVQSFLATRGFVEVELRDMEATLRWIRQRLSGGDVYHEIYGPSPRGAGLLHSVVGCNGSVVHDPHPSRAGLAGDPSEWHHIFLLASCAAPIAAQLDQTTERAAFEAWMKTRSGYPFAGAFANLMWDAWQAARRATPAAAQLDAELPPLENLPTYFLGWDDGDGPTLEYQPKMVEDKEGDYFKAEDVRQVVAPYAERIRLLTEELAKHRSMWLAEMKEDAELDQQIRTTQPVAWVYECLQPGGQGIWAEFFSRNKPGAADYIRNVRGLAYIDGRTAGTAAPKAPDPTEAAIEQRAKEIYAGFVFADRYPWVDGGNSIRQDDARDLARKEFAAAPSLSGTEEANANQA